MTRAIRPGGAARTPATAAHPRRWPPRSGRCRWRSRGTGTELSHDTISDITDAVAEEVKAWQARPLEELYPVIYLDALVVKVRDGHQVRNKAAHIAAGADLDGIKHVLGIWVQQTEGAKFWAG